MKKGIFRLLLVLCLVFGVLTATASAEELFGTCSEGEIIWVLDEEGTITFTGEGMMSGVFYTESGAATDKEQYGWQDYKDQIRRVVINEGITSVGGQSFSGCKNLTEVVLPESLTIVEKSAFSGCDALTSIDLPTTMPLKIEYNAFGGSGLTEIILPDNVTDVGTHAFFNCKSLTKAKLSNNQFYILRESTFQNCSALTEIDFGTSVSYIADHALYNTGFTELVFPDTVTFLDDDAIASCDDLVTLDLGDGMLILNDYAVQGCGSLKTVIIGKSLYSICWNAFKGCEAIEDIYISDLAAWCRIDVEGSESSPTIYADNLYLNGKLVEDLVIPKGITSVPSNFVHLSCIKTVMFADSVTEIGAAFQKCSGLTTVVIPGGVTELSPYSFYKCDSLETIYYQGTEEEWAAIDPWASPNDYYRPKNAVIVCNYFGDVSGTDFYAHPVLWAYENGITSGTAPAVFGPKAACNRAQVVTFLWRAKGCPEPTVTEHSFEDVQPGSFYEKAVLWAVENGITTGTDATHFSPDAPCNRATVVTFLHRAEGTPAPASEENPFTDVASGSWYGDAVLWAVENGITNGLSADAFGPTAECNRAQVVTFLYRAYGENAE